MSFQTLAQMFQERSEEHGAKTLLLRRLEDGTWEELSWETCAKRVRRLTIGLASRGVKHGDRIALLVENRPEWLLMDMAAQSLGAVTVPLYTSLVESDIEEILRDCDASLLVTTEGPLKERALHLGERIDSLDVLVIGAPPITESQPTYSRYENLLETPLCNEKWRPLEKNLQNFQSEDLATIIYTSGTSGPPKGVMLTHQNLLSNCQAVLEHVDILPSDRALSFLPLSHSFERTAGHYVMLYAAAEIAYAQNLTTVSEDLTEAKPTVLLGVPRFYEKIYSRVLQKVASASGLQQKAFAWGTYVGRQVFHHQDRGESVPWHLLASHAAAKSLLFKKIVAATGGRLRYLVSGGAPLAPAIIEFFEAVGLQILEGYGLTETSPVISCNQPENRRLGSVGRPLKGLEVKIADDGEILVRGPSIMKGYYGREADTKAAFDQEGFFCTGDVGSLDEDGFLFITDRKKDIIITAGGKNVAPQNIENKLQLDPLILQACVIGDSKPFLTALLVPDFDAIKKKLNMSQEGAMRRRDLVKLPEVQSLIHEVVARINESLATFESIKRVALLPKPFSQETDELTPTLKLKRRVVNRRHAQAILDLYENEKISTPETVILESSWRSSA